MEDTLREPFTAPNPNPVTSLNPCFNGRYSQSFSVTGYICKDAGLNPCFNGRYSQSASYCIEGSKEDCLNPCFNGRYSQRAKTYVPLYTSIWSMFKLLETLLLT